MSESEILAIIVPKGTANTEQWQRSVAAGRSVVAAPPFERIEVISIDDDSGSAEQRNQGIDQAKALQASWILFVEPDEQADANALAFLSPGVSSYDGLWGGITLIDGQGQAVIAERSQFCSADIVRNFHMALQWWVGKSHFVRTALADRIRFDPDAGDAWYSDYLVRLWDASSCLKTAQPITSRTGELPRLAEADRHYLLESLSQTARYFSFQYQGQEIFFAYTGRNPALERVQLRSLFYEQADLESLGRYIKPGSVCVDVGANTGNHTIFFEKVLGASKVIPIEPNPDTVSILKRVIEKNGLTSVDISKLGVGVGRESGRFEVLSGRRGYLGTAYLKPARTGRISVEPLDTLIDDDVDFLKIDVEKMEIDVLEGAKSLISRCRPVLLVEVVDENIARLLAILNNLRYRIEKIFPDQGYANYLALPEKRA